jgi:AcrR family transcriptional regulator
MPKPDVSEARTEQILLAAAQVFSQHGIATARMEDVAQAAGLSKGTLYLYFASKEALVAALLQRAFVPLGEALHALRTDAQPLGQALLAYADAMLGAFEAMRPIHPLILEYFALAARVPELNGVMSEFLFAYRETIRALLDTAQAQGSIPPLDSEALATALLGALDGALLLGILAPEKVAIRAHGLTATRYILAGAGIGES